MAYANRPVDGVVERNVYTQPVDYHDRVRWGPIFSGLVVAISTQLVLTALGAAIGATFLSGSGAPRSNADEVGTAVGIGSIIYLFISLFVGGWVTARACGPMNRGTALLNGAILWATTLAISSWLLANGVSGAFGVIASNAGEVVRQAQQSGVTLPGASPLPGALPSPDVAVPSVTAQQTRDIAGSTAKVAWSFAIGSLLGLVSAMMGASAGARSPRANNNAYVE